MFVPKFAKNKQPCAITRNDDIRQALIIRITELGLIWQDVILDAKKHGIPVDAGNFSRYINKKIRRKPQQIKPNCKRRRKSPPYKRPGIGEQIILWLCRRYGIDVNVTVKLNPYEEKQCIMNANNINSERTHKQWLL